MEQTSNDDVEANLSLFHRIVTQSDLLELMPVLFENLSGEPSGCTFKIPHTFAKRRQKDSLKRNEAVLGDSAIPSTSTGLTSHLESEPETTKKMKGDDSQSEDAENDYSRVTPGPGDKLGEDELTLIFSNTWLSAQDLLNLRLVSRRWRDAATTTLRHRDACVVKLCAKSDLNFHPLCVYENHAEYTDEDALSQLTELISISPKFPATDFRIPMNSSLYTLLPDLLNFYKLHGDKIKTLRPHGWTTARCLLDILQIYAPNLQGLDLSEATILNPGERDGSIENALKRMSKAFSLKSLTLGEIHSHEFHRLLLSSLPKLNSIENVTMEMLQIILTEGKGHLIRSFEYHLKDANRAPASQLTKFVSLNPKPQLSKVTLDLETWWPSSLATIINSLNEFIASFKDTVQTLKLFCDFNQPAWDPLLNIPPMKNLKSFTLKLKTWCGVFGVAQMVSVFRFQAQLKFIINIRGTFFQFQDGISAQNYFPNLMEVHLHSSLSKLIEVSPMSFFSFESHTDDGSSALGFFPQVDILKINRTDVWSRPRPAGTCHSPTETSLVTEVFPNIRILKFQCGEVSNLSSALWTLCPNVEFMEIYGIASCSSGGKDVEMSRFVDKVFTGMADGMLQRLRRSAAGQPSEADDLQNLKFDPRISDLRRLRELKLKFAGKWSTQFASSITGVCALSKMENTKFIISYDHLPEECESAFRDKNDASRNKIDENIDAANGSLKNGDDEIAKYEELIFGPLKPYVHIVHERRKYDMLDD